MAARWAGGMATMTALAVTSPPSALTVTRAVGVPLDAPHDGVQPHARTELVGHPQRDLLGAAGEAVLLRTALDVEHPVRSHLRP